MKMFRRFKEKRAQKQEWRERGEDLHNRIEFSTARILENAKEKFRRENGL